jgi:antitoxin (DNA-binding transcriptional repressor) of toxin-antitoxin stability system
MPSISVSQFRNARQLMAWLKAGETVLLVHEGRVIARIVPEQKDAIPAEPPDDRL